MFFNKKNKHFGKCFNCNSKLDSKYSYCPNCGCFLKNKAQEEKDFGLLGRTDALSKEQAENPFSQAGFGITGKMLNSLFNTLVATIDKELRENERNNHAEVQEIPNGIKIQFSTNMPNTKMQRKKENLKKVITKEQIDRMSKLPRTSAKSSMKRLGNKIIYELTTPGIQDINDILFSKTESGYEIKAICKSNVYVNTLPVNLPLKRIGIIKNKTYVEFIEG